MAPSVSKLKPLDMEIDNFIERNSNKLIGIAGSNGVICKDAFQQTHLLLREKPELLKHNDTKVRRTIFWALRGYAFPPYDAMTGAGSVEVIASEQESSDEDVSFVTTTNAVEQQPTSTSLTKIVDILTNIVAKQKTSKETMRRVLTEVIVNGVTNNHEIAKQAKITERRVRQIRDQAEEAARSVRNKILEIFPTQES